MKEFSQTISDDPHHYLRTNARTLENWEQGRAKPNAQAALLIRMVAQFPDMVQRLATI